MKPEQRGFLCLMHLKFWREVKVGKRPLIPSTKHHQRYGSMPPQVQFDSCRKYDHHTITWGKNILDKGINPNQWYRRWLGLSLASLPDGTTTGQHQEFKPWRKWTLWQLFWSILWSVAQKLRLQKRSTVQSSRLRMKNLYQFQFRLQRIAVDWWGKREFGRCKAWMMFWPRLMRVREHGQVMFYWIGKRVY